MYLFSIIVGASMALFVGGLLVRSGRTGVAKTYVITAVVLLIASILNLSGLISVEVAHAVRWLLFVFAPAALILAIWAVKRDRDEVMGRRPCDREAVRLSCMELAHNTRLAEAMPVVVWKADAGRRGG